MLDYSRVSFKKYEAYWVCACGHVYWVIDVHARHAFGS